MIDKDLKQHVENALDWEPSLDAKDIGVRAVANDLSVHVASAYQRTDTEIAQAAVLAIKWHSVVPDDRVTVTVKDGWITLAGTLDWRYQKDADRLTVVP
jgi:osmotically-inducible protein OsmY